MKKRPLVWSLGIILFVFTATSLGSAEPLESMQSRFIHLSGEARRLTGPLFWLHGDESKEQLEEYVRLVAEGGNGCFTAESRPHSDWLGEGWYRDLGICLEAARKNDLKMWIFDEKWWPSGEVGGRVPQQYRSKYLQAEAMDGQGPKTVTRVLETDHLIAVLAGKTKESQVVDGETLLDLTARVKDGHFSWQVPDDGPWTIMFFTWTYSQGRRALVDGASQEAVDWLIRTVYQPHYDRFKDDFGDLIPGFFYDEPETEGDWGTEVIPMMKARGVDWKKALVAWKFTLAGDQQAAGKYQYQDAFAEAWGQTLFGGITRWCHAHRVRSIGHFLEHRNEYLDPHRSAGNMFQLQKYSDMGGIDAVFAQFVMGRRVANDAPTWQTPKLGSSITHAYGKSDDVTMVEIFGARGQDLTYPEMKWWTDHMQVSGVNFHIPHSFNPRAPHDTDCPPYFYNGGHEPRWPLYRVYADYTSRLSTLLSGGRHVCPVALLFPGNSVHVGQAVLPEQISEALQDALYDCDWLPYDVFENDMRIAGRQLSLREEAYRVLVIPPVEVIPTATLAKARQFFESGGMVVGYDFLPVKPADLDHTAADISLLRRAIWGDATPALGVCKTSRTGGRSYLLGARPTPQQLQQVLGDDAGLTPTLQVLQGETDGWLHVLHRVKDERDLFFICNQNVDGGVRPFRFRVTARGFPECWDPMRAEIRSLPFDRRGDHVELTLPLAPLQSMVLVFVAGQRPLPSLIEAGDIQPVASLTVRQVPWEGMAEPPVPLTEVSLAEDLKDCSWCWSAQGDPASSAPAGVSYFRTSFEIPDHGNISEAYFVGTADNEMSLFVNGKAIAAADAVGLSDWHRVSRVDLTPTLQAGRRNTLAIAVLNATDQPSPAGLIGKLTVIAEDGSRSTFKVDSSWKVSHQQQADWLSPGFNDAHWDQALAFAEYGSGPWGRLDDRRITVSPIAKASGFQGQFDCGAEIINRKQRVVLQMAGLTPEAAARLTVNGTFAGGCIGEPLRKDITGFVRSGANTIRIEPFCPESVVVNVYPK